MKLSDFHFDLPDELIARYPAETRTSSRLLCLNAKSAQIEHNQFVDLLDKVRAGDLLVFNNTKVVPARFFAKKQTGGLIELLFERLTSERQALLHMKANRKPRPGAILKIGSLAQLQVIERKGDLWLCELVGFDGSWFELLKQCGEMPLPPYIKREGGSGDDDKKMDMDRYQTVYAQNEGAVAAPTAGLHFDEAFLEQLKQKGCDIGFVTLHVGAGTFQPIRSESISDHVMHSEYIDVDQTICSQVKRCKARGGRVIAIGTTSVRCLETAGTEGELKPYQGETSIFIYPGYHFQIIDALVTNFHLPESTLMLLVSALASRETIMQAYESAVKERYRFFSYGDAMFIDPQA